MKKLNEHSRHVKLLLENTLERERRKKKVTVTSVNAALSVYITVAQGHSRVQVLEQSSTTILAIKASVDCHHTKGDLELLFVPNCFATANCGMVGTQKRCTRLGECVVATESFSDLPTHSSSHLSQQGSLLCPLPFSPMAASEYRALWLRAATTFELYVRSQATGTAVL